LTKSVSRQKKWRQIQRKKCHSSKFPNSASFLLSSQSAHRIYIIRYSKLVDMSLQFFRSIGQLVGKKTPNVHPIERSIPKSCHQQWKHEKNIILEQNVQTPKGD